MKATNPSQRIKRTRALLRRIGFQRRFLGGAGVEGGERGAEAISNGIRNAPLFSHKADHRCQARIANHNEI
jgi:hypothetical protein